MSDLMSQWMRKVWFENTVDHICIKESHKRMNNVKWEFLCRKGAELPWCSVTVLLLLICWHQLQPLAKCFYGKHCEDRQSEKLLAVESKPKTEIGRHIVGLSKVSQRVVQKLQERPWNIRLPATSVISSAVAEGKRTGWVKMCDGSQSSILMVYKGTQVDGPSALHQNLSYRNPWMRKVQSLLLERQESNSVMVAVEGIGW